MSEQDMRGVEGNLLSSHVLQMIGYIGNLEDWLSLRLIINKRTRKKQLKLLTSKGKNKFKLSTSNLKFERGCKGKHFLQLCSYLTLKEET